MKIFILTLFMAVSGYGQVIGNITANRIVGGTKPAKCQPGPPADVWIDTSVSPRVFNFCGAGGAWIAAGGGSTPTGDANAVAFFDAMGALDSSTDFTFTKPRVANSLAGLVIRDAITVNLPTESLDAGLYLGIPITFTGMDTGTRNYVVDVDSGFEGTFSELIGVNISLYDNDTTASATVIGFRADVTATGATDGIGLLVRDVTGATNNYAIKTGAGLVQFGDNLNVGSSGAWKDVHAANFVMESSSISTDTTTAHTGCFASVYDVDGMAYKCFGLGTNGNTPDFKITIPTNSTYSMIIHDDNDNTDRTFLTATPGNTPALSIAAPSGGSLALDVTTFAIGGVSGVTGCIAATIKVQGGVVTGIGAGVTC